MQQEKRSRADNRAQMQAAILELGRQHLSTHGAAGLSLRAIARELGVVSSAVYRYVPSRDELLTLLLVEGYTDLADTFDAAADHATSASGDQSSSPHRAAIVAGAQAAREWARTDPPRWALLYGSPVPGYAAPAERTVAPGTRMIGRLLTELDAAHRAGELRAQATAISPPLATDLGEITAEFDVDLPPEVLVAAITLWASMIGGISLEVFGQYGADTFTHPAAVFDAQFGAALSLVFA